MEPISIALAAAPGLFNLLGNQLGKDNYMKDPFFKKFQGLSDTFLANATKPFTKSQGFLAPLTAIRENQREASRIAANNLAGGGTAESQVALQGQINKNTARSIAQLAGQGPEYQNMMFNNAFTAMNAAQGIKQGYDTRRISSAGNLSNNLSQGVGNLLGSESFMSELLKTA